jgi:hypothetical protein
MHCLDVAIQASGGFSNRHGTSAGHDFQQIPFLPESTLKRSAGEAKLIYSPWGFEPKARRKRPLVVSREEIYSFMVCISNPPVVHILPEIIQQGFPRANKQTT